MSLDLAAIEELYERFGPIVYGRCLKLLRGDEEEARDVAQEVFLRVLRGRQNFRADASVSTWIYRITTNLCLTRLARRPVGSGTDRGDLDPDDLPAARNPERESHWRGLARRLIAATDQRTLTIALHYFVDGMTQHEIAAVTGVSRRTVGKRLRQFKSRAEDLND